MLPTHNQKPSLAKTKRAPGINNNHRTSVYQVYIAQLHRRALMLDSAFKDKVLEALTKPIIGSSDSNKSAQETTTRLRAIDSLPASSSGRGEIPVEFEAQGRIISASVYLAPVKKLERMRIKLARYMPPYPRSQWPISPTPCDYQSYVAAPRMSCRSFPLVIMCLRSSLFLCSSRVPS